MTHEAESETRYRTAPGRPTILVGTDGTIWQAVRPQTSPHGYFRVSIGNHRRGIRRERCFIHRLVLETFVGPRPLNSLSRHLNDVKSDNRLCNLAWGTWQDNTDDRIRNEHGMQGSGCPSAKLHESDIPTIFGLWNAGESLAKIAKTLGVSKVTINSVLRGTAWTHAYPELQRLPMGEIAVSPERASILREARRAKGLTQPALAALTGVSAKWICQIEKCKRVGTAEFWKRAAITLETPSLEGAMEGDDA